MTISDAIRAEIERQGLTAYRVAKLAGVGTNVVSRFLRGERDITLGTADRIATALGLVVVRAAELPAARPAIDRRDCGAMMVGSVEMNEGRRAVANP